MMLLARHATLETLVDVVSSYSAPENKCTKNNTLQTVNKKFGIVAGVTYLLIVLHQSKPDSVKLFFGARSRPRAPDDGDKIMKACNSVATCYSYQFAFAMTFDMITKAPTAMSIREVPGPTGPKKQ